MIEIKRLVIENFQSHKSTELTFSGGLNVIVGSSDQGKSAIVRAVKWVLYNEPRGTDFIRQGTKSARVMLELSNGYAITRERTPSKNRYILKDPQNNMSIYEGFGNEIPPEIIKAHGIPKVILDTDKSAGINIASQLDGPFMLSESGATRAKAIGRLSGIHIIDSSIRDCMTDIRREHQICDRVNGEIIEINEKLVGYDNIIELGVKLEKAQGYMKRMDTLIKKASTLENKGRNFREIQKERNQIEKTLSGLGMLKECIAYTKDAELKLIKMNFVQGIKKKYRDAIRITEDTKEILEQTSSVPEGICLFEIIYNCSLRLDTLKKTKMELKKNTDELNNIYAILKNMDGLKKLGLLIDRIGKDISRSSKIIPISEKLLHVGEEIRVLKSEISLHRNVEETEKIILLTGEKLKHLERIAVLKKKHDDNLKSIHEGLLFAKENKKKIDRLLETYISLLQKEKICPLCKSDIKQERLNNIARYYKEVN